MIFIDVGYFFILFDYFCGVVVVNSIVGLFVLYYEWFLIVFGMVIYVIFGLIW